ncbi:MAG: nuclear transport factor 2 family protein [Vulcanimicrobiaceae bacterium]
MTEPLSDFAVQAFVTRFAAAWAERDAEMFLALWHADGTLHYPLVDRPLAGSEIGHLVDRQKELFPDLVWQLLDWTSRGDVVIVEWQATRLIDGRRFDWRGVDKLRLRAGKIVEERVYMDTALLRAARTGQALEPLLRL